MVTTYPATGLPDFHLEDKHADIQATRGHDFHYTWQITESQVVCLEYIPGNWPCLDIWTSTKTIPELKASLEANGFEIEE